jgi:hypothetical protein
MRAFLRSQAPEILSIQEGVVWARRELTICTRSV